MGEEDGVVIFETGSNPTAKNRRHPVWLETANVSPLKASLEAFRPACSSDLRVHLALKGDVLLNSTGLYSLGPVSIKDP